MTWSLRILGVLLLLTIAWMTVARRADSGWVALASNREGEPAIFLMTGDGGSIRKISPDSMCSTDPRWSPDGQWIAFSEFCLGRSHLFRMRPGGSGVTALADGPLSHSEEQWSPNGEALVLRRYQDIYVLDVDTSDKRLIAKDYVFTQWSPDGEWIYAHPLLDYEPTLERIHLATNRVERLLTAQATISTLSWSPDAAEVVLTMSTENGYRLFRMRPDGSALNAMPVRITPRLGSPLWSPDGEWIAFLGGAPGGWRIYRIRHDGRDLQQMTEQAGNVWDFQWSPDSEWLLFSADFDGSTDIFRLRADGSELENLTPAFGSDFSPQYAPVAGRDWHPALMTLAVLVILAASVVSSRVWQALV